MRKLLLGTLLVPLLVLTPPLAPPARSADGDQAHDFYRYLSRVAESAPNLPFIGAAADDATFIGWTGGGSDRRAAAATVGSGSSGPPQTISSADEPLSATALARAAVRSADRMEASR